MSSDYLLDTNIVSHLLDPNSVLHGPVSAHYNAALPSGQPLVSVLTVYELYTNADRMVGGLDLAGLLARWVDIAPVPPEPAAAHMFGRLKVALAKRWGGRVGALGVHNIDLVIATTALVSNLVVASNDAVFQHIQAVEPALRVADWTAQRTTP